MTNPAEQAGATAPIPEVWHEAIQIHSYDVDFRKRVTPEAICRMFLEAAWNHAERLGFGYSALAQHGRFWVLARMLIEVHSVPVWGDRLGLNTWPRGISGLVALRDFEFVDSQGRTSVAGTSSWLILDTATRRPQRLDRINATFPKVDRRPATGREAAKIPAVPSPRPALNTRVHYSHVDVNNHVNSARYVGWLIDSYSQDFHKNHMLHSIELNFTGEALWSDEISVRTSESKPLVFGHSIVRSDHSEVCRAVLAWKTDQRLPFNPQPGDHSEAATASGN